MDGFEEWLLRMQQKRKPAEVITSLIHCSTKQNSSSYLEDLLLPGFAALLAGEGSASVTFEAGEVSR
jgi:hypothetical protein